MRLQSIATDSSHPKITGFTKAANLQQAVERSYLTLAAQLC